MLLSQARCRPRAMQGIPADCCLGNDAMIYTHPEAGLMFYLGSGRQCTQGASQLIPCCMIFHFQQRPGMIHKVRLLKGSEFGCRWS